MVIGKSKCDVSFFDGQNNFTGYLAEQRFKAEAQSELLKKNYKHLHEYTSVYYTYDESLSRVKRLLLRLSHLQIYLISTHAVLFATSVAVAVPLLILIDLAL